MNTQPNHASNPLINRFYRQDDPGWHWLENADDSLVRDFIEGANQAHGDWLKPLNGLAETLYQDHLARRELAVTGLKTTLDVYCVWSETDQDADHPRWWRHPIQRPEAPECFFDVASRAAPHAHFDIGGMALSSDEDWLAWTEDKRGDERYQLWIQHLPSGEPHLLVEDIGPELCWAEDLVDRQATLVFSRFDDTQRPDSLWRLPLSLDPDQVCAPPATLILRESDPEFWLGIGKTRSRRWLLIESASKETTEVHLLPASHPAQTPFCLHPRETGVDVSIDHRPGHFYRLHNRDGPHFQLDRLDEDQLARPQWKPLLGHRTDMTLEGIDAFRWGLVVAERDHHQAQTYLRRLVFDQAHQVLDDHRLEAPEAPFSQSLEDAPHFDPDHLRLCEASFTTPPRWIALDLSSGQRTLVKQMPVHGSLMPEQLVSRRYWASSEDGTRIPVSVVMRADLADQALPTLLYGYGAYGESLDPWFSIARLGLLERGVAFAVAHVRGGGERGEPWYLDGKLANKENSFTDFIAARHCLAAAGVSDPDRIVAYGASAGGLLVGTCINRAPDAFCAAVLDVPFVDVLRTMRNPELPLTTAEYSEWGNPDDPEVAERIRHYSPVDNVIPQDYPALWLEAGWHDSRVAYWEAAKFYAHLVEAQQSKAPVLLRTDMQSGHGGASGRFKAWRDAADQDAFILWAMGLDDSPIP